MHQYPHHMTLTPTPHAPDTEAAGLTNVTNTEAVAIGAPLPWRHAMDIAHAAHEGMLDKQGAPYIHHLHRVAYRVRPLGSAMITAAALLHDVLEDTPVTALDLLDKGIHRSVVKLVELLTHEKKETYEAYIHTIQHSGYGAAVAIKLADLDDHLANPYPGFPEAKIVRYRNAYLALAGVPWGAA